MDAFVRCSLSVCKKTMRLIDADELLDNYKGNILTAQTDYAQGARDIMDDIRNAPTIDAVPEREAEWIEIKGGMKYRCSECNGDVFYKTRYCPRCGAKMG